VNFRIPNLIRFLIFLKFFIFSVLIQQQDSQINGKIKIEQETDPNLIHLKPKLVLNPFGKLKMNINRLKFINGDAVRQLTTFSCSKCPCVFISQQHLDAHSLNHKNTSELVIKIKEEIVETEAEDGTPQTVKIKEEPVEPAVEGEDENFEGNSGVDE
jgi:hypothetical protein